MMHGAGTVVRIGRASDGSSRIAMFVYAILVALVGIPLIFPDGQLPQRRFR